MATKEEAKNKLKKAGYSVVDDNSVITVLISENGSIKNTVKNVTELFVKMGYDASFGVRQHKKGDDEENLSDETEILNEEESDEDYGEDAIEAADNMNFANAGAENNDSEDYEESISTVDGEEDGSDSKVSVKKKSKSSSKKSSETKTAKANKKLDEDEYFDDEDDDGLADGLGLDSYDMDMILSEDGIQFSLDDFGMM